VVGVVALISLFSLCVGLRGLSVFGRRCGKELCQNMETPGVNACTPVCF